MKKISTQAHFGQRGINFIERRMLDMGCLWHPTGQLEAGIDGFLELRNPTTGELPGVVLAVQSKATSGRFQTETDHAFDYLCQPADLEYWLSGSWPVILVCSRPDTNEAYWISVKDYFRDPGRRRSRKAHFEKRNDAFGRDALPALLALGSAQDAGLYLNPPPKPERLVTNLLPVEQFPETFMVAETVFRHPKEVWDALRTQSSAGPAQWILIKQQILSFHDLTQPPWLEICDQGTADTLRVSEWSESDSAEQKRQLVWLLSRTLVDILAPLGVRYDRRLDLLYFGPTRSLTARSVRYYSQKKRASRIIFQGYPSKKDRSQIAFYRHNAVDVRFHRFDGRWYLQLAPTYHFTSDGVNHHPWRESYLSGIKRQESNAAVLGQVIMWADLLKHRSTGLFESPLRFGSLLALAAAVGITDALWLSTEEPEELPDASANEDDLWLFAPEADE